MAAWARLLYMSRHGAGPQRAQEGRQQAQDGHQDGDAGEQLRLFEEQAA
jgi:hypothetical protein